MRVLKFGGTSVASTERINEVSEIVASALEEEQIVVVVSALAGVTSGLLEMLDHALDGDSGWRSHLENLRSRHKREMALVGNGDHFEAAQAIDVLIDELDRLLTGISLIGECPETTRDTILSAGERLSALLVAATLMARGIRTEVADGSELILADRGPDGAEVLSDATAQRAVKRLSTVARNTVVVVTGFVASDPEGRTITLGRGGSDLSATVLGVALGCRRVEIWTDVDGVMSAPPLVVRDACTLPVLSVDEAAQLAFFGAKVLHPTCLAVLGNQDIPVLIRNTRRPEGHFTTVRKETGDEAGVRAVAAVEDVTVFDLKRPYGCDSGWARRLDQALAAIENLLLVGGRASAEGSWTLVVPGPVAEVVAGRLASHRVDGALVRRRASLVALVGASVLAKPWDIGQALEALGRKYITVTGLFSASNGCAVSVLVGKDEIGPALESVHEALNLGSWAIPGSVRREAEIETEKAESGYSRGYRQCWSEARSPAA